MSKTFETRLVRLSAQDKFNLNVCKANSIKGSRDYVFFLGKYEGPWDNSFKNTFMFHIKLPILDDFESCHASFSFNASDTDEFEKLSQEDFFKTYFPRFYLKDGFFHKKR